MKLYNTLTRSLEPLTPLAPPAVTIYVCGPTVYDEPHIGHARSAYVFDGLRRYLTFRGYRVSFVRNVTDVDDKIIEKARHELATRDPSVPLGTGKRQATASLDTACREVAERYLARYHEVMDRLGIARPDIEPLATEHVVPEMTDLIATLLLNGAAYETKTGVYFAVRRHAGYGRLSHRTVDELQAGARVEPGEDKRDPLDFALWKTAKPGEPSWKSPWGEGRPGWHIECSAMSTKYLGETFDIHGGGVDLVFPHHENEVAQAEAASKPFAKCWVHNGLLTVNGEKMSKSLGNYVTVDNALHACKENPDILKTFFLSAHYRSPVDYAPTNLQAAAKRFNRWFNVFYMGRYQPGEYEPVMAVKEIDDARNDFLAAMDDDLNTPQALAALDQLSSLALQWRIDVTLLRDEEPEARRLKGHINLVSRALEEFGRNVFGLTFDTREVSETVQAEAEALLQQREEARRDGNYRLADGIRERIHQLGFIVEDTPRGPQLAPRR